MNLVAQFAEDLQSAAKLESAISNEAVQAACIFRDVLKGSVLEQLQSLEAGGKAMFLANHIVSHPQYYHRIHR